MKRLLLISTAALLLTACAAPTNEQSKESVKEEVVEETVLDEQQLRKLIHYDDAQKPDIEKTILSREQFKEEDVPTLLLDVPNNWSEEIIQFPASGKDSAPTYVVRLLDEEQKQRIFYALYKGNTHLPQPTETITKYGHDYFFFEHEKGRGVYWSLEPWTVFFLDETEDEEKLDSLLYDLSKER